MAKLAITLSAALLSLSLILSPTAKAGDDLKDQVKAAVEKLKSYSAESLNELPGNTSDEFVRDYKDAVKLIQEIAKSDLSESKKIDLMGDLAEAAGRSLEQFTEPYENISLPLGRGNPVGDIANVLWSFTSAIIRDASRAVGYSIGEGRYVGLAWNPIPGIASRDERRSDALNEIGKTWIGAIDTEIEAYQAAAKEGNPVAIQGLKALVEQSKGAESIRDGALHLRSYNFIKFALGIGLFLHPTIVPFEMTTYAPLVAGTMWSTLSLYLARVRRMDSGLDIYRAFTKFQKRLIKAGLGKTDCNQLLESRDPESRQKVRNEIQDSKREAAAKPAPNPRTYTNVEVDTPPIRAGATLETLEQFRGTPKWNSAIKDCYDECVISKDKFFMEAIRLAAQATDPAVSEYIVRDLERKGKWNIRPDLVADAIDRSASSARIKNLVLKTYVETHRRHPSGDAALQSQLDKIETKLKK